MLLSEAAVDMTISAPQLGKTLGLGLWLLAGAWSDGGKVPWPTWITAPTYDQVKHAYLNHIVEHARTAGILRDHTTTPPLKAVLINGQVIEGRSWESPEGLYGPTVARMGSDEFGFLTPEASAAISSRLTESRIRGLGYWRLTGNVSEVGGEAEAMYRMAQSGRSGWASRTWTWRHRAAAAHCACGLNGDSMSLDTADRHEERCERGLYLRAIADRRAKMSKNHFDQLYEAEWIDWSALPAYTFTRAIHVTADVHEEKSLPLDLSCDFNLDPMSWVIGQHDARTAWALDEIVIPGGATTQAACAEFLRRYPGHGTRVLNVFGDASGKAGSTKSTRSDYQIIEQELRPKWPGLRLQVPNGNGPVTDRLNAVNAMLLNGDGETRYYLHPKCEKLATDYARVSIKPGTRDLDKSNKQLTHSSDAEGYRLVALFPVQSGADAKVVASAPDPAFDGGLATAQF